MGHNGFECKKPKLAGHLRLCFGCGKPGHLQSKCPHKAGAANLVESNALTASFALET